MKIEKLKKNNPIILIIAGILGLLLVLVFIVATNSTWAADSEGNTTITSSLISKEKIKTLIPMTTTEMMTCTQTMLDEDCFETIVQFVLDNGWDSYLFKDDSLNPVVEYKKILVYIIPDSNTTQRENVSHYNHIIIYGADSCPAYDKGPRFDIHKEDRGVYIEEKTIHDKDTINAYMAVLKEMVNITSVAKDMGQVIGKKQFENIVQFVLNNGEEVSFSSLWGDSHSITYKGIVIYLTPNPPYHDIEYQKKMRKNMSHYNSMTIFFNAEGGHIFNMGIREDNAIYIYADTYVNKILYENEIVSVCIPLLEEMMK